MRCRLLQNLAGIIYRSGDGREGGVGRESLQVCTGIIEPCPVALLVIVFMHVVIIMMGLPG